MLYLLDREPARDELHLSGDYCARIVQSLTDDSRLDGKFKKHVIIAYSSLYIDIERRLLGNKEKAQ